MRRLTSLQRLADKEEAGGLSVSSRSALGLDQQNSLQRSSIELLKNAQITDPYKDVERFSNGKKDVRDSQGNEEEKYSPIWSSVGRKNREKSKSQAIKVENCKAEVTAFPTMNMAPIDQGLSRHHK